MSRNVKHQSTSKTEAIGYIGTGPAGATLATGQIEETNATKKETRAAGSKLVVLGTSEKSNLVTGHMKNTGALNFAGKWRDSKNEPANELPRVGQVDSNADVIIAGGMKLSSVCGSMTTNGISFTETD